MKLLLRSIKNVLRSRGRSTAIVVVLIICFSLGILMTTIGVFSNSKIENIKEELGTTIDLNIKTEYMKKLFEEEKGGIGPGQNPFLIEEEIANIISKNKHIKDSEYVLMEGFESNVLISGWKKLYEEQGAFIEYDVQDDSQEIMEEVSGELQDGQDFFNYFSLIGLSNPQEYSLFKNKTLKIVEGGFFNKYDIQKDVCIIEKGFSELNNLEIGSNININSNNLRVIGIYENLKAEESKDKNAFFTLAEDIYSPISTVQKIMDLEEKLSHVSFTVDNYDNVEGTVKDINEFLEKNSYQDRLIAKSNTWEYSRTVSSLKDMSNISKFGLIGAFGAGFIIIISSMFLNIRTRAREIGVLKAIGASNFSIVKQFLVENVAMCLIALVFGLIITSFSGSFLINDLMLKKIGDRQDQQQSEIAAGYEDSMQGGMMLIGSDDLFDYNANENIAPKSELKIKFDYRSIIYSSLFSIAVTLIGTIIPAISIARVQPAKVLRSE
ncbi:MAG TPA: hypothetical protein DCP02_07575 [Actinobacteria bacterium]|nr:hypothetical protein [Actinomycetota bacterium]